MYISRNATLIESEGFSPANAQRDDKSRNSESTVSRHLRVADAEGKRNENRIHGKEFSEHKKAPKWCCEDIDFLERLPEFRHISCSRGEWKGGKGERLKEGSEMSLKGAIWLKSTPLDLMIPMSVSREQESAEKD